MMLTWFMPAKKNIVMLREAEHEQLEKVSRSNRRSVREKLRARILLLCDTSHSRDQGANLKDSEVAQRLRCAPLTVSQVRKRAVERGALAAIAHKEQEQRKARKLDGVQEAHLIALTCSTPPAGHQRWSLRLLRDRLIEMEVVESIGVETIRSTLKKTS